ncbi:acyl carrier protein [Streptomyces sp. NPDC046203]|uniref:acyl carrier protein n=1 Tax=Streptomyces sp. NPDC046203 TaxID=3154602 RepID=UPI0033FB284F
MPDEIAISESTNATAAPDRDDQFEAILRKFIPFLSAGEPLTDDAVLRDLGLDSMGTVELLATLESTYGVRFKDDALNMENFANPAILWQTLTRSTEPAA